MTLVKKAKYGGIHLNGEVVTVRAEVNLGDLIEIYAEDNVSEGIPSMDIPLTVLYEDEDILAVDKPTDMPTHPSKGNNLPTLAFNEVFTAIADESFDLKVAKQDEPVWLIGDPSR